MDKRKAIGLSAVMLALLLNIFVSVYITGLVVSDTDPTTYIVVVMLMLFVFVALYAKDKSIVPDMTKRSVLYGAMLFAVYLLALSYSRVWLSTLFMSYRIDMLLLPIFILAVIVAVFGAAGAKRMKLLVIYSVFASPLLLLPILNLNSQFTLLNADIIAGISGLLNLPLTQNGILLIGPLKSTVSISSTCANIGAFAALVMFLVPLAYLYDGKKGKKAIWVVAGLLLLLLFNLARMMAITLVWLYYGITSAVYVFHLFGGEVLFIIVIVFLMLAARRFGLRMPKVAAGKQQRSKAPALWGLGIYYPLLAGAAFGTIGLLFSLPYLSALNIHATPAAQQTPAFIQFDRYAISLLESARMNVTQISNTNSSILFALGNLTNSTREIFVLVNYTPSMGYPPRPQFKNITGYGSTLLKNGIAIRNAEVDYNRTRIAVSYLSIPYSSNGSYGGISFSFIENVSGTYTECTIASAPESPVDSIEESVFNAFQFTAPAPQMCASYYVANSINSV